MNIWFNAALDKYRFNTSKGNLATEDLFDLKMEELDIIYSNLAEELDDMSSGASLFENANVEKSNDIRILKDKMNIIKSVFNYHKANKEAIEKAAKTKAMKDELNEVIAKKQKDELANLSVDELKQIRDAL